MNTLWEKEKAVITSNFSFSHSVFNPFRGPSRIFIQFEIVVCKVFQFDIWEGVKTVSSALDWNPEVSGPWPLVRYTINSTEPVITNLQHIAHDGPSTTLDWKPKYWLPGFSVFSTGYQHFQFSLQSFLSLINDLTLILFVRQSL